VTGGHGFAGRHLRVVLAAAGRRCSAPAHAALDLLDAGAVEAWIARERPDEVYHLAARASVEESWRAPRQVVLDNVAMTINLLEAVRARAPGARVLVAGSGEVYGPPERLPVDEGHPLRPQSPYAASKAAGDLVAGQNADAHGLHVVRARAFNHAGPGQSELYVAGSITRQLGEAMLAGAAEATVTTGNPDAERDFTDVRDVVAAYVLALGGEPGVLNVASGRARSVRELVAVAGRAAGLTVRHRVDPGRLRPADVPRVVGSARRLAAATGWRPRIALERTLADAVAAWRAQLAGEPAATGARRPGPALH
jgi:GDP-4-dehydro-6-deoxy-D-mannose reductase